MRVAIALATLAVAAAPASTGTGKDAATLARATAGRTPGAPVECITRRPTDDFQVAGRSLIFRVGTTTYVNQVSPGCETGSPRRALVFRSTSSQLCRGEIAQAVDPLGGASGGSCTLGAFVPYARR